MRDPADLTCLDSVATLGRLPVPLRQRTLLAMIEVDILAAMRLPFDTRVELDTIGRLGGSNAEVAEFRRRVAARLGVELSAATVLERYTFEYLSNHIHDAIFGSKATEEHARGIEECLAGIVMDLPAFIGSSQISMIREALHDLVLAAQTLAPPNARVDGIIPSSQLCKAKLAIVSNANGAE